MSSVTTSTTVWPRRPAVLVDRRGEDPDVGGALRAALGQPVVGERGAVDVDRVAVDEVLRRRRAGSSAGGTRAGRRGPGSPECPRPSSQSVGAPRPGCSQLPAPPSRAARPWLRPAWSALSSDSCRAPLRDVEGSTGSSPAARRHGPGSPDCSDAMPQGETSGGLSAILDTTPGCDAALRVACVRGVRAAPGSLATPSRPRRSATAARSRRWSAHTGRRAGATVPPRDIALITPQGYRSSPGRRHEPYVYKRRAGTLTFCTARAAGRTAKGIRGTTGARAGGRRPGRLTGRR